MASSSKSSPDRYHEDIAYVYAFLNRFASMEEEPFWPQTCAQLEESLKSTELPSSQHDMLALQDDWVPSMEGILGWFYEITHKGRKPGREHTPSSWLPYYADQMLYDPTLTLRKRWSVNKLTENGTGFYGLTGNDKATFLHSLVDYALVYSDSVRDLLVHEYNLQHGRVPRRDNNLQIEALGKDQNRHEYFEIDDTGRLYKAGNPYKKDSTFEIVCSTEADLDRFINTLATPDSPAKLISTKQAPKSVDLLSEKQLRNAIKKVIPRIEEGEARLRRLADRRRTLVEEKEKKERAAAKAAAAVVIPRELGTRRSARRVNYKDVEDGVHTTGVSGEDSDFGTRRSKRIRDSAYSEEEEDTGRRSSRIQRQAAASSTGRKSSRLNRSYFEEEEEDPVLAVERYEQEQARQRNEDEHDEASEEEEDESMEAEKESVEEQRIEIHPPSSPKTLRLQYPASGAEHTTKKPTSPPEGRSTVSSPGESD